MGRISVEMSAQTVSFHGDIACSAQPGALKNSVFDEVTDAVELGRFVTGAPAYPNSRGYRPEPGHVFGQDGDAIWESSRSNVVNHLT
jgi:hypothetical protein